ncbi:uncharacterized protein LOC143042745 isoform X4 [Mytilus galloprovincialis]|uniref:uncharacterized protein LOC143042745 isoform X4 n=1 Tax=Mytilus galloprovincialis TaxID=29158 RepID=UPI003F7BA4BE
MLYVCFIFLFTFLLNEKVLGNSCENDNCTSTIDIPLITHLNAPLKAELDISILTEQLKELIGHEVKQAVSTAMKDIVENIVDKRARSAVENLQTFNNLTISTFLQEMEDVTARKSDLRTMEENLNGRIEQMKEKQNLTESKLSAVEADFERSTKRDVIARKNDVRIMEENLKKSIEQQKITESKLSSVEAQLKSSTKRVALTAFVSAQLSLSVGSVVKFSDVKFSEGISDLSTFKSTGKFKCGKNGLYIVSVTIEFDINGSEFYIYVNGKVFTRNYKLQRSNWWHSSTAVIAIELNTNDTVWVQIGSQSTSVREDLHSRFTIIKIH